MRFVRKGFLFLWGNHTRLDDHENYCLFTNLHSLLTPHPLCMWNGGKTVLFTIRAKCILLVCRGTFVLEHFIRNDEIRNVLYSLVCNEGHIYEGDLYFEPTKKIVVLDFNVFTVYVLLLRDL